MSDDPTKSLPEPSQELVDAARLAYPPTPLEQLIDEIYADDTDNS